MQCVRRGIQCLNKSIINSTFLTSSRGNLVHTSAVQCKNDKEQGPTHFLSYNEKIYPPQTPDEPVRPAYVCHMKKSLKYSPDKLWYIAAFIRGMSIDEAMKQLSFMLKKGSTFVLEALKEAQDLAVEKHNVEFRSNLWVAESFVGKAQVLKGIRRHARNRMGRVEYKYVHYFVRLEEGKPPEHYYYYQRPKAPEEQLDEWLTKLRRRKVISSL